MSKENHLVLVIGAGPAGMYATGKLTSEGKDVVVINRDIKYGGLAEYGIFVSKHKMKEGIRKQFRKILANDNTHYFGNVKVGSSGVISLEELKAIGFDAVVYACGAQGTKKLGVKGEDSEGVYHAKDLVYHYNHLPPFSEQDFPVGDKVAIIGVGNVMVDIAHWLTHYKNIKEVVAVARRGPVERAYTDREMKTIAFNMDKDAVKSELDRIKPALDEVGQDVEQIYSDLTKNCEKKYYPNKPDSQTKFSFKFLSSPTNVVTDENGKITGLTLEHNKLVERNGRLSAKSIGESETISVDNVVFAVGDRVDPSIGLPLNEWKEYSKNETPYEEDENKHLYEVFDNDSSSVMNGNFVVGWARKASDGLVGKAKKDAETGINYVLTYLSDKPVSDVESRLTKLNKLFSEKSLDPVLKSDIVNLEAQELKLAQDKELEFYKYDYNNEMLEVVKNNR